MPPAAEHEIAALEGRLGRPLPPSYRALLEASSPPFESWLTPAEVDVVHRVDPFTSVLWVNPREFPMVPLFDIEGGAAKHLLGLDQPGMVPLGHLLHAVVVCAWDANKVLLDPLDVDADGEWRVWDWSREGCAGVFRSLNEYLEREREEVYQPPPPPPHDTEMDATAAAEVAANVRSAQDPQERFAALRPLLDSRTPAAMAALRGLMREFPDDPPIIGNALNVVLTGDRDPEVAEILRRSLSGPNARVFASGLAWRWPELVDETWRETGDPELLIELVNARRPGTIRAAVDALARPDLAPGLRARLTYTLSHTAGHHPDAPEVEALLATVPLGSDVVHVAQALLGWGAVDKALGTLGAELEESSPPSEIGMVAYLLNQIAEMAPPAAAPVLIASLLRRPTAQMLRTLAFIDHPQTVPAITEHLDGELRLDALIALEQLATPPAREQLAARAEGGDLEAARALARLRDGRALEPLIQALDGPARRSAVTGLRDLQSRSAQTVLERLVREDPDDDVAVLAAHGLVMTAPAEAGPPLAALLRRDDEDVKALAGHWLSLIGRGEALNP